MSKIISSLQSTFIPKRDTHDNMLITQEILNSFGDKHKSYITVEMDMEKGLITSEHGPSQKNNLSNLCFSDIRVNWIIKYITTTTLTEFVNSN